MKGHNLTEGDTKKGWKNRRLEEWKIGRLEDWKNGRLEGTQSNKMLNVDEGIVMKLIATIVNLC